MPSQTSWRHERDTSTKTRLLDWLAISEPIVQPALLAFEAKYQSSDDCSLEIGEIGTCCTHMVVITWPDSQLMKHSRSTICVASSRTASSKGPACTKHMQLDSFSQYEPSLLSCQEIPMQIIAKDTQLQFEGYLVPHWEPKHQVLLHHRPT